MSPNPARVLVLGPDPYQRSGIRAALERSGLTRCQDAAHGDLNRRWDPVDVVVLAGPARSQVQAADDLRAGGGPRRSKLVAMLSEGEQSFPISLLRADVRGLVNADGQPDELVRAVRCVLDGGLYIAPAFAEDVLEALTVPPVEPRPQTPTPAGSLTPREHDILDQLACGHPNATIARALHISEKTVKFHVSNILAKYQFRSRTELIVAIAGGSRPTPVG